ncbi:MAG TPA: hypothetical protein VMO26_13810 [Vicinamibacterales bacterium]|nr:hypothetical protein [Vicinamibacterales bacterium]
MLALLFATPAAGQATPDVSAVQAPAPALVELRLQDGSVMYGVVEQETADRLVLRTIAGVVVEVDRAQLASVEPARGRVVAGQFWRTDSNATRLLFAPTARSLRKGEGYIGVYEFLLPFVQVGVTDRLTIGAGTPLIFVGDEDSRPVWLTPKYQVYKGSTTSVALGVMHFVIFGENSRVGLAYTVATTGTDDNAFSVGAGWAYARYREDDSSSCFAAGPPLPGAPLGCTPERTTKVVGSPVLMASGERRVSRRVKVITENYAFKRGGIIAFGVRFIGERLSADLGLFAPVTSEDVFVLAPIVNFVWSFGK